jgi:hypothetical protein
MTAGGRCTPHHEYIFAPREFTQLQNARTRDVLDGDGEIPDLQRPVRHGFDAAPLR